MNTARLRRVLVAVFAGLIAALALAVVWAVADSDNDATSTPQAAEGPRINDHWHAPLRFIFRGTDVRIRYTIPSFSNLEGIHTHGDDILHMHPTIPEGEGEGASLRAFFGYVRRDIAPELLPVDFGTGAGAHFLRADSGIHPLAGGEGASFRDAIAICDAKPESEFDEITLDYNPQDGECIRIVVAAP